MTAISLPTTLADAYDTGGRNLVHPRQPELVVRNLWDLTDPQGRHVIRVPSEDPFRKRQELSLLVIRMGFVTGSELFDRLRIDLDQFATCDLLHLWFKTGPTTLELAMLGGQSGNDRANQLQLLAVCCTSHHSGEELTLFLLMVS